jgi:hypothetical protein
MTSRKLAAVLVLAAVAGVLAVANARAECRAPQRMP